MVAATGFDLCVKLNSKTRKSLPTCKSTSPYSTPCVYLRKSILYHSITSSKVRIIRLLRTTNSFSPIDEDGRVCDDCVVCSSINLLCTLHHHRLAFPLSQQARNLLSSLEQSVQHFLQEIGRASFFLHRNKYQAITW